MSLKRRYEEENAAAEAQSRANRREQDRLDGLSVAQARAAQAAAEGYCRKAFEHEYRWNTDPAYREKALEAYAERTAMKAEP